MGEIFSMLGRFVGRPGSPAHPRPRRPDTTGEPLSSHRIDEVTNQRWRGSGSLASIIEACFKISLATSAITNLIFQLLDLHQLVAGRAASLTGINLGLLAPPA